jgi:hypothetical protein
VAAAPAVSVDVRDWTLALANTLLPVDVNASRPVRLDCDDEAVAVAGATLGVPRSRAVAELVATLRVQRLVGDEPGVMALARDGSGQPPLYLLGLAVLVLAASRMARDEHGSMAAYYRRVGEVLDVPLQTDWPQIRGVPELVGRFADLARWMEGHEVGRRGLLDLPADVHPRVVGVPINQSLLRAGDRRALGAFFERTSRLIDAGWDPVHQLSRWGGRHQLSAPLQALLERSDLHPALAGALRAACRVWDGSTIDAAGQRILPAALGLHVPPGHFTVSATVPTLETAARLTGPDGSAIILDATTPAAVSLDWLRYAETGPMFVDAGAERVRLLPGPTILFEISPLGMRSVAAAADDSLWVLTCDPALIASCGQRRLRDAPLPANWALLCDIEPTALTTELRTNLDEARPLQGVRPVGGLRVGDGVWLVDHPPALLADLPERARVLVNGASHGAIEPDQSLSLDRIAHTPGVHTVEIGEQELVVELVERGGRRGIGSLAFDGDPRRIVAGPRSAQTISGAKITGPLITPPAEDLQPAAIIVRYRCTVEVIDADGAVRNLGPPGPAAWLDHVGLSQDAPWEIPDAEGVAWVCVDAPGRKFVVANQPVDVPATDDVLDVVEWYADAQRIVDRSGGGAQERWQRLLAALEAVS